MQVKSLKLTVQDVSTKDAFNIAAVLGTLVIDTGKTVANPATLNPEPELEEINFTTALNNNEALKNCIQSLIIEALTLKKLKISKESGTLAHTLESYGVETKPKKGKRVSKTRNKK